MSPLVILVALLSVFAGRSEAAVDLTVADKATGSDVVEAVVDMIQQSCIFTNDRLLLRRIAYVETYDGLASRAFMRDGVEFYGGIWQVDEASFDSTKTNVSAAIYTSITKALGIDWSTVKYSDLLKPLYSGLAARLRIQMHYGSTEIPQGVTDQANYWSTSYTINQWTNATSLFTKACETVATDVCSSPKADVVFVVDGSGSITASNFQLVKEFVAGVAGSFDISQQKVRVGLIEFSGVATVQFDLTQYDDKSQVVAAIGNMPYFDQGTNSAEGLKSMSSMIQQQGRHSDGVPVVSVFLTDGRSNDPTATANEAATVHQQLPQVTIFSVGVGSNVDVTELNTIATEPSCLHVYSLASFADITAFTEQLLKQACRAQAELLPSDEISGELEKDQYYYFKIKVHKQNKGIKVQIKAETGAVKTYFSWKVQNPSVALYDTVVEVDDTKAKGVDVQIPWDDSLIPATNLQTKRKRSVADTTAAPDVQATLYGAVVGVKDTTNKFNMVLSSAFRATTSTVLLAVISLITLSL